MPRSFYLTAALLLALCHGVLAGPIPDDFPRFVVPGKMPQMDSLRSLFWLHYEPAGPLIPLWDEWMAMATLWPAIGEGDQLEAMRRRWAQTLAGRPINAEGYVLTMQHDGPAHAEGWPFPRWMDAGGAGWHFRGTGVAGYDAPLVSPEGWKVAGGTGGEVSEQGWIVSLTAPRATVESPEFTADAKIAPWVRINWWATGLDGAKCYLEWTTQEAPEFSTERRVNFDPPSAEANASGPETRTMIPVYRHPGWKGVVTKLRIGFDNAGDAQVVVKSIHTASDTRHNVNNLNFIRACHDYFLWSRDVPFLQSQMGRVRAAMRFVEREFQPRQKKCIYTTWPGHEGRSGVRRAGGEKQVVRGEGVGSNYWDLLPFGGEDALATIYYYDTLHDLAELEEQILRHPEWAIPDDEVFEPTDLRAHAAEVKAYGGKRFWNPATGRFGTVDLDGVLHDYGLTFLNNEAVYYDFATPEQAAAIHSWISGARVVEGDTSTGADIYHWRFGPRSTTLRNLDYYFWGWSNPEDVPWGYQVQDGGSVLGWSYHDLMARLKTGGPDAAAARLDEIARWFEETQAAGGYREYYGKDPSRGTMQGGNVAGGLGLDREFFESVLLPQVMLYGFLGFQPTVNGFAIDPRLPADWPELTITRIHLHNHVLDVTATQGGKVTVAGIGPAEEPIEVSTGPGVEVNSAARLQVQVVERRK